MNTAVIQINSLLAVARAIKWHKLPANPVLNDLAIAHFRISISRCCPRLAGIPAVRHFDLGRKAHSWLDSCGFSSGTTGYRTRAGHSSVRIIFGY